jgi:hypothetical protein
MSFRLPLLRAFVAGLPAAALSSLDPAGVSEALGGGLARACPLLAWRARGFPGSLECPHRRVACGATRLSWFDRCPAGRRSSTSRP